MAVAVGNRRGIPKRRERRMGAMAPTARPHTGPQRKPHRSTGMCMGNSLLPIWGI